MKKTKIVATIGPITADPESIGRLIGAGVDIFRLNGSHNTVEWHKKTINNIRRVNETIPILVDLPGRKIRTGNYQEPYSFKKGEVIILTSEHNYTGHKKIPVNYERLHEDLKNGNLILADDGTLQFEVLKIDGKDISCRALCDGVLKQSKGINVPYVKIHTPPISEKDILIINMCLEKTVDFVGVSFVESAVHVQQIYELLKGSNIQVISKIENQFGLDSLESIIKASYAILIDRGDLSAETELHSIAIQQKRILRQASKLGKPVIVATEMLHTMIEKPHPTKAEVSDITNAILDGCSATMLSGETAAGLYPFEAVNLMTLVAQESETELHPQALVSPSFSDEDFIPRLVGRGISDISSTAKIDKIICFTKTGYAAKILSQFRLRQPIFAITDDIKLVRQLRLYWGVTPFLSSKFEFQQLSTDGMLKEIKEFYLNGTILIDDTILVTAVRYPNPETNTRMNYLEIHKMKDLVAVLGWSK